MGPKQGKAKLTTSLEDYLEAILLESSQRKVVRVKHLMKRLGVKSPSVNGALKKLKKLGLVNCEPYGYVELTAAGRRTAKNVLKNHRLLTRFLTGILGVDRTVAEQDACIMEHGISKETQQRLSHFLKDMEIENQ